MPKAFCLEGFSAFLIFWLIVKSCGKQDSQPVKCEHESCGNYESQRQRASGLWWHCCIPRWKRWSKCSQMRWEYRASSFSASVCKERIQEAEDGRRHQTIWRAALQQRSCSLRPWTERKVAHCQKLWCAGFAANKMRARKLRKLRKPKAARFRALMVLLHPSVKALE